MIEPYWYDPAARLWIYHGDCSELLPQLAEQRDWQQPDLMLTDPPYGVNVTRLQLGSRKVKKLDRGDQAWDDEVPDINELLQYAEQQTIWGGNCMPLPTQPSGWLVWDKDLRDPGNLEGGLSFSDAELAWSTSGKPVRMFKHQWRGAHAKERQDPDRYHPTQKPVALMKWCLSFFPDVDLVIDPFMGSGTTLRACKNEGIACIGIEREERFCKVAVERLRQEVLL